MPLPLIPFLLLTGSVAAAGGGIGAMSDARKKNKEAQKIVDKAKEKWEPISNLLAKEQSLLQNQLEFFGKKKVNIFDRIIGDFLRLVKDCANNASSTVEITKYISKEQLKKLEKERLETLKIVQNGISGVVDGALAAGGVYGLVGMFGSASTGTAIASLSGAAAQNATLAWLGGGSLAAGGGGIALGTTVLGGLVAGPAILFMGLKMDKQAEENLTKAKEFEANVEKEIEIMKKSIEEFKIVRKYVDEASSILIALQHKYYKIKEFLNQKQEEVYQDLIRRRTNNAIIRPPLCQLEEFNMLLPIVKSIKDILETDIIDEKGNFNTYFKRIIDKNTIML